VRVCSEQVSHVDAAPVADQGEDCGEEGREGGREGGKGE